jgi:hypothetical protein
MKNEIQNTVSGGFMALHRLREPSDVRVVSQLFAEELPSGDFLSLCRGPPVQQFHTQSQGNELQVFSKVPRSEPDDKYQTHGAKDVPTSAKAKCWVENTCEIW